MNIDFFENGWECPKCGAVMSPTTSVCVNCRGITHINTVVTAESAISALQEAAKKFKDVPPDAFLGLQIGRTMNMGDEQK